MQLVRKAIDPPGDAREDWKILCDMARAAGYPMPDYSAPEEVYAEIDGTLPGGGE